jgi:hypothetical protein
MQTCQVGFIRIDGSRGALGCGKPRVADSSNGCGKGARVRAPLVRGNGSYDEAKASSTSTVRLSLHPLLFFAAPLDSSLGVSSVASVSVPVRTLAAPAVASVGASISRCSFCEFHCGCCSIFDCLSCALLVCWGLSCADAISDQGKGSAGWCACRFEIKAVKYPYQKRSRGSDSSAIATEMAKLPQFNIDFCFLSCMFFFFGVLGS